MLFSAPVYANVTVSNNFTYLVDHSSWKVVGFRDMNAMGYVDHGTVPDLRVNLAGFGVELRSTSDKVSRTIDYRFDGCDIEGNVLADYNDYTRSVTGTTGFVDRHPVVIWGKINEIQPLTTRAAHSNAVYTNLLMNHDVLATWIRNIYGSALPPGSYIAACKYTFLSAGALIGTAVKKGEMIVQAGGGTNPPVAGFSPSILSVQADKDRNFVVTTRLNIPAIAGGKLVLTSNKPVSVNLGAGPSSESTSISTSFTKSGTATGDVTIRGQVADPGVSNYLIRATSIYE